MRETGTYQILGPTNYFIPHPLPPANPPLVLTTELMALYGEAIFALGKLNEMGTKLPDQKRFIKAYVIKEALLSSAIEGIHTTLIDVFTQPLEDSRPSKNTQLVINYTRALDVALEMVQQQGLPIVSRVLLKAHEALMSSGEGDKASPGMYRKQSVQVGNLTPPPAQEIPQLMATLETYINQPSELPPLIRAGLAHLQFETIHPFLDGNGRIGRLLIVLMLINDDLLTSPLVYPSYYFKKYHADYYRCLDRVRTHGDFEGWIAYYLQAIRDSAVDAYKRAQDIEALEVRLKAMLNTDARFVRLQDTASLALNFLFTQPVTRVMDMSKCLDKAYNTTDNILQKFMEVGIVSENGVTPRKKIYRFEPYLALLEKEYL